MSRDEMSALQGKRLNKLVNLVYHNVPFYRNKHMVFRLLLLRKLYVCTLLRGQPEILPLWDIRVVTCLYGPE